MYESFLSNPSKERKENIVIKSFCLFGGIISYMLQVPLLSFLLVLVRGWSKEKDRAHKNLGSKIENDTGKGAKRFSCFC